MDADALDLNSKAQNVMLGIHILKKKHVLFTTHSEIKGEQTIFITLNTYVHKYHC